MAVRIPLRPDFDAASLRGLARQSRDPDRTRRLFALAEIYADGSRKDAARIGGARLQIVRNRLFGSTPRGRSTSTAKATLTWPHGTRLVFVELPDYREWLQVVNFRDFLKGVFTRLRRALPGIGLSDVGLRGHV